MAQPFVSYGSPEGSSIAVFKSLQNTHYHSILPFYYSLLFYSSILLLLPLYSSILRLRMSDIYYRVRICIMSCVYIYVRNATCVYTYVALLRPRRLSSRVSMPMRANSHACLCVGVALLTVCLVVCDLGQVSVQDDIIRDYFEMGFSYQLILCFLSAITYHSVR